MKSAVSKSNPLKGKRERDFVLIGADGIGGTSTKKKLTKRRFIRMYVNGAIKSLLHTETTGECIAAMNVISMTRLTRGNQAMERSNVEKYLSSVLPVKTMFVTGLLAKQEYSKIELFLAEKYCIKKGNLYRQIDLTIPRNKVIDIVPVKEVKNDEKNYDNRHITKIAKED